MEKPSQSCVSIFDPHPKPPTHLKNPSSDLIYQLVRLFNNSHYKHALHVAYIFNLA